MLVDAPQRCSAEADREGLEKLEGAGDDEPGGKQKEEGWRRKRRLGENDAWIIATAESIHADIVGADRAALERLGTGYIRYR